MMKQMIDQMTVQGVRDGLQAHRAKFDCEIDGNWLDSKSFENIVIMYVEEMDYSVNEIVTHFKAIYTLEGAK